MLRVLTLSTLFPTTARPEFGVFVERQAHALAARPDIALRIVAPVGIPPFPLSALPRYRSLAAAPAGERWAGLDVHRPRFLNLPGLQGRLHARMLVRALLPLLDAVRRDFPFDVIATEYFFPDGLAAIALGERLGVPVTIKARGSDIHHWAQRPAIAPAIRSAGRRADRLFAVSAAMRDDLVALGMPPERIDISYTGVDAQRFAPQPRAAAKAALGIEGPLVVALGALVPVKDHALLLDALALLPGVTLWIAGEGPERPALEQRIAALGLGARARLLGGVPRDAVPTLLAAADAMALASRSEGLANAWVEALACGTPVVIPDVGGAREVVASAAAGRVVARTPQAFAGAIGALLAEPPDAEAVRAAAQRFRWPATAEQLAEGYARAVAHHREQRRLQRR